MRRYIVQARRELQSLFILGSRLKFSHSGYRSGFTLIELLVVVAIIGILATVVILNVSKARIKSSNAKIKADVGVLTRAIDMHMMYYSAFPNWVISNKTTSYTLLSDDEVTSFIDDSSESLLAKAPIHPNGGLDCVGARSKTYCSTYNAVLNRYLILFYYNNSTNARSCYWTKNVSDNSVVKTCNLSF